MHHIYTTQAFIIHSTPYGEAGKFLLLFTRDFGMIGAIAQGIRLNKSKLRYHIQDFSFSLISLVRGKEVWRITGANEIEKTVKLDLFHIKIFKLLHRLLQGEEKNEKLFEIINELYRSNIEKENNDIVELIVVLRILNCLGYIYNKDLSIFFDNHIIDEDTIGMADKLKKEIIKSINLALKESQL